MNAFVGRRRELDRIRKFGRLVAAGRAERHLAIVGVRRIGKSRLIERYVQNKPSFPVAIVQVDAASTTIYAFLLAMVRESVNAVAHARKCQTLSRSARPAEVAGHSSTLDPRLGPVVARALSLMAERRFDGQEAFAAALTFPEEVSRAIDAPMLVIADEFEHITDLAVYPPFDAGRRRSADLARLSLLAVVRTHLEFCTRVGWVVTGSAIRPPRSILSEGPLAECFEEILMGPFDADDTERLAAAIWAELGVRATDNARARVYRLTQGHPFYADVTCREAAVAALRLDQVVSASMVDGAFIDAVCQPHGRIATVCKETYASLGDRAPALRGLLQALAANEPADLPELAERMRLGSVPTAYRYADELQRLGMIEEVMGSASGALAQSGRPSRFVFADPVFRYWVAGASDPLSPKAVAAAPDAARRVAQHYEEEFLYWREQRGTLPERDLRNLCRKFAGQSVDGRWFGAPGRHITLPYVSTVGRIVAFDEQGELFGKPGEVELNLCFGDDEVWLCEVRGYHRRTTVEDLHLAARKAAFLRRAHRFDVGPLWFVSAGGFDASASEEAARLGIYISTRRDVEALDHGTMEACRS